MSDKTWIEEQKDIDGLFTGGSHRSDADKMFEISRTNRNIDKNMGRLLIVARTVGRNLGVNILHDLANEVELAQLTINKDSRKDFLRIAIEQWQGKLQANKTRFKNAVDQIL